MHNRTLRLDDSLYRRTKLAAAAEGVSDQRFINRALEHAVNRAASESRLLAVAFRYADSETCHVGS